MAGREPARLAPGAPARLNLLDLASEWVVDREHLASRSHNCPFHGWRLKGRPRASVVGGAVHRSGPPGPARPA